MERWTPSNAISTTCSGRTCTTWPSRWVTRERNRSVCQARISSVIPLNVLVGNYDSGVSSTPSQSTGSRTAGYALCLFLAAPIALMLGPFVWGVVFSAGFVVTALCVVVAWGLRERERTRLRKVADSTAR